MFDLAKEIKETKVTKNVTIWWMAQAGFVFKTKTGKVIYLDTYLSDCVERLCDFVRISAAPIDYNDVECDVVLNSHEHPDHLDVDALPVIAKNNPGCVFAGAKSCKDPYKEFDIEESRQIIMEPNKCYEFDGVKVYTCRSDHGELAPDALSLLLDFDGFKVLFTGDTAFRPEWIKPLADMKPDVLLPCINGAFGNLNSFYAAAYTEIIKPKVSIPCHHWMFAEHGGNPAEYKAECAAICPDTEVILARPGRKYEF